MPDPLPACDGEEPYVFVSYSHADEDRVFAEIRWLQDQGLRVWYDQGISAGSEWTDEIAHAIECCAAFVYFVSPASVESRHCRSEVQYAIEQAGALVVVHLAPTQLPSGLRLSLNLTQAIFAHELPQAEARHRLLEAVQGKKTGALRSQPPAGQPRSRWAVVLAGVLSAAALSTAAALFWLDGTNSSQGLKEFWAGQDFMRRWPNRANLDEAREHFEQALAANPENALFHAALCRLELTEWTTGGRADALKAADRACRTAIRLEPESWQTRGALAQLLVAEGKHAAADETLSKALTLAPDEPQLYETLGDLRAGLQDQQGAISAYSKAIELEPQYWSHYESLGSYLYASGRYADAAGSLETAVNLAPRDAIPVWNNLANAYLMSGQLDQAEAIYQQTIQVQETAHSHDALGRLHDAQGCATHAAASFRKALKIDESWRLWGALGESCMTVPQGERVARLALQKALQGGHRSSDRNGWRLAEVAFYYSLLGETELARNAVERIDFTDQASNAATAYYLAETYRRLGDRASFDAAREAAIGLGYPQDLLLAWGAERPPCEKPAIENVCSSVDGLPL